MSIQPSTKRWAILGVALAAAGGGALAAGQAAKPAAPVATLPAEVAANRATPPAAAQPGAAGAGGAAAVVVAPKPPQDPTRARITFTTIPMTNAKVQWGKNTLGMITPKQALTVVRPRDSGPLDVMVYAPGYLPVQTRAHTFEDSQIIVKLTTPENKSSLWGYRAPLDAGVLPADQVPTAPEEISGQPL